jgi:hypothetical protein
MNDTTLAAILKRIRKAAPAAKAQNSASGHKKTTD